MASMYKKRGIWYLSVMLNRIRLTKSLRTREKIVATRLKPQVEYELLSILLGFDKKSAELPFNDLVRKYLKADHGWSKRTNELNTMVFNQYLSGNTLPTNTTSRAIYVRTINACWNWGLKNSFIRIPHKLTGETKGESRIRVLNKQELNTMIEKVQPILFRKFVSFAYYTGARRGEIARTSLDMINGDSLTVKGKTGTRLIKLTKQSKSFFEEFNFKPTYISHQFKKEARRLGIPNIRFHDLRRTFGYNLIKQGRPIYEVSKLLGHSSVTVTERHYAPLMTTEIDDFTL